MLSQQMKVVISFVLSLTSVVMYFVYKGTNRKLCMFAMLSSTIADIFMTDIVNVGSISTYFGAGFFILAHIIYAICFILASKRKNYNYFNLGFYLGIVITLLVLTILTILMIKKTSSIQSMYISIIGYLFFIGLNLVSEFSYAYSESGVRLFIALGMLLFIFSDFLVLQPMLNICLDSPIYNDYIWFTYAPAQLLIILFNSDFKKV